MSRGLMSGRFDKLGTDETETEEDVNNFGGEETDSVKAKVKPTRQKAGVWQHDRHAVHVFFAGMWKDPHD